jgi:PIN domain nuclease of toxin-antitoxin system
MRLLLDTHILLWSLVEPGRLGIKLAEALNNTSNEILFSPANIWEVAIKSRLQRDDFAFDASRIFTAAKASGFVELKIDGQAAIAVGHLPPHHRDPFDRILLAQAISAPAIFCTADAALAPYAARITFFDSIS